MDGTVINETWRTYATICRLCLQKDGFMLGIFNHIYGKEKSICKKIIDCTALPVHQGDGLPNVVCHRCLFKIEFCLEFRQLCFMSDATLRQLSGMSKETNLESDQPQLPFYEQLGDPNNEANVVMVVDPNTLDYDSGDNATPAPAGASGAGAVMSMTVAESDNDRQSDAEANDFEGKNVSMCKFCDHAFTDRVECEEHEKNAHNSQQPYSCVSCSMNFADRLQYSAHMKGVHKNDKPYNCPQCEKTFARRSDLRKHTIVHTGVKPYTCSVCLKSFSRNTNLSKHMRIHSGKKPFVCRYCPRTFTSKGDLNRHMIIHTGQKPFRCNYCHLTFGRKDKLLRHEKRHWPQGNTKDKSEELRMMRDNIALDDYARYGANNTIAENFEGNRSTETEENMVINLDPFNHNDYGAGATPHHESAPSEAGGDLVKEHNEQNQQQHHQLTVKTEDERDGYNGPNNCDGSDMGYNGNNSTSSENKSPAGSESRPYKCFHCDKRFSSIENMRYHEAVHSGARPFACHYHQCNKSFIRKRELDRHMATHTGAKPFKCLKCPKSFGRKDKLVRHARIHERRDTYQSLTKTDEDEKMNEPCIGSSEMND